MKHLKNILSGNIRALRNERKLSQNALAERAGLSMRGIQEIEYKNAWPELETLDAIAKALGVTPSRLFRDPDATQPTPQEALRVLEGFVKSRS